MENKRNKIVIIHESLLSSWAKDIVSFLVYAGLLYFNHRFLAGRLLIDVLFIFMAILLMMIRGSKDVKTFYSWDEAKDYINERS